MSNSVLNTYTETQYRILLLLSILPENAYTQQWLSAIDYITIYPETFGLNAQNLHGNSWMRFTEYATRFWNLRDALHSMSLHGWVIVKPTSNGYIWKLSNAGKNLATKFSTSYADPYKRNAALCYQVFGDRTGEELDAMIRRLALTSQVEEDAHD